MVVPALLRDLLILFLLASAVLWVFHRLRLPSITGFLLVGMVAGPHGARWVHDVTAVRTMAEIGVVLLLFTIGAEFSLRRLLAMGRHVLGAGVLQVAVTIAAVAALAYASGARPEEALVLGFVVSLSSTAVVMRLLAARGETAGPAGRATVGILIFQDLCVVPMMLVISALTGEQRDPWQGVATTLAIFVALLAAARMLIPRLLEFAARARSHELFVFTVGLIILGTAWLSGQAGLSLSLGAFVAGMVVADNEYSHQVLTEVLPFRESFIGLFFTSVGMLVDPAFLAHAWLGVLGWLAVVIVAKILIVLVVGALLRYSWPVAVRAAFALSQIGEFSFVLAGAALAAGVLAEERYQTLVSVTVASMLLTPWLIGGSEKFAVRMADWRQAALIFGGRANDRLAHETTKLSGHVVIVGFGLNGRRLAQSLHEVGVPAVALEIDPSRLHKRDVPVPVLFGDAASAEVLSAAGLERAQALVVGISDVRTTMRIVQAARVLAPEVPVLVRCRHLEDVAELYRLGAHEVIVEEVEANLELLVLLLRIIGLQDEEIRRVLEPYLHHPLRHPPRRPPTRHAPTHNRLPLRKVEDQTRAENPRLREK